MEKEDTLRDPYQNNNTKSSVKLSSNLVGILLTFLASRPLEQNHLLNALLRANLVVKMMVTLREY